MDKDGKERKLVSIFRNLGEDNTALIRETAERCGFTACFYKTRQEAGSDLEEAEIVYASNPKVIAEAKNMKWLCSTSAGVDQFIRAGIAERPDVFFTNASGAYGVTISEHIVMVTLMMMRRMPEYMDAMSRKEWKRQLDQRSIFNSRVLILGTGNIGSTTARRLRGFEPESIIGVSRSGRRAAGFDEVYAVKDLDRVLPDADLVICCVPETTETIGIMSAERIALLKPTAYLVNVGRGSALDHDALAAALKEGRLAGAAIDVYIKEPFPLDAPIWDVPNLLLTPHISGDDTLPETRRLNAEMFCEDIGNYAAGRPLAHTVDIKLGY